MSQTDLGEAAGLTLQGINRIERGGRQARASNLEAIARALKCTVEDLMTPPQGEVKPTPTVESLLKALTEMQNELHKLTSNPLIPLVGKATPQQIDFLKAYLSGDAVAQADAQLSEDKPRRKSHQEE